MVSTNEHAPPPEQAGTSVDDLDLPFFDLAEPGLAGEVYHQRLAALREQGWLARSPLALVVLDHASGEFFLRAKQTAFPGREIAGLFGVTGGRLREQIDANILNQTGERHRRLRSLVWPAFTPRAAAHWRPVMREFVQRLWADLDAAQECEFVAAFAKPYPSLTIAAVLGAPLADAPRLHEWSTWVQRQFDIRALGSEPERIEQAVDELYDYVEALLELAAARALRRPHQRPAGRGGRRPETLPHRVHQPGPQRHRRGSGHHPGPALARDAAVRRPPGAMGPARHRTRAGARGGRGGAQVRADHPVHGQDLPPATSSTVACSSRPGASWRSARSGPTASRTRGSGSTSPRSGTGGR